jgi:hypothetical protein
MRGTPEQELEKVIIKSAKLEGFARQHGDRLQQVEEITGALADWRAEVDEVLDALQESAAKVAVVDWMTVDDEAVAVLALSGLAAWIPKVYARYLATPPPPCWPWHPPYVARLLSLQAMHRKAVKSKGPDDFSTWLRLRDDTESKLVLGCDSQTHEDGNAQWSVDSAYLDEYAVWHVRHQETGGGADEIPPGLTRKA